jgi:arginine kinase
MEKENIKIENLEKIETIPLIKDFHLPEESTVFLKKFLNKDIFEKLKNVKTSLGGHISHIIYAGMKVDNKETVGIYATDGEAYTKFQSLFQPAISFLQDYDKYYSLFDIPDHRGIFDIPADSKISTKLNSIRFKYARNLKNLPYLPYAKQHTRKFIHHRILNAIKNLNENIDGIYYDMESISQITKDDNPELFELENKFFDKEENFFSSFGLSKEHSGIFLSQDKKIAYLINFNDHLQIVAHDDSANFKETYQRIKYVHDELARELEFDYHPTYGYLTTCPSNIGMGLKISAWLEIPNTANQGNFLVCCKRWSLRFKKHSNENRVLYEIISKHKMNVSEVSFINSYITKIISLINFEHNLLDNPNYIERQLDSSKMKEAVKHIYQNYFDKYKFVVTPNRKSFNSLFKLNTQKNTYDLLISDKESYVVFKDFIYDYIAAIANVRMSDVTKLENRDILREMYTSYLSQKDIEEFDNLEKENLKKTTLVLKRNTKNCNFTGVMSESDLKEMYLTFLDLANKIQQTFGGTVIEDKDIENLYKLDFNFISEELNQMLRGKGIFIPN